MTYVVLGPWELTLAALLLLVPALLSVALQLKLLKSLGVAAVRTVLQLGMLGLVLGWVFSAQHAYLVLPVLAVMIAAAAQAAVSRSTRRYRGIHVAAFVSLVLSTLLVTFTATEFVIGVDPWWQPQYVIPLAGMLLGNALTGVSLALDRILTDLDLRRDAIEARLALGIPLWQATLPWVQDAVRTGMVPILNAMSVVGLVSLPGMMTGQILAGADPQDAVAYQILIMFMIASATAMTVMLLVVWSWRRLAHPLHRVRWEAVQRVGKK